MPKDGHREMTEANFVDSVSLIPCSFVLENSDLKIFFCISEAEN